MYYMMEHVQGVKYSTHTHWMLFFHPIYCSFFVFQRNTLAQQRLKIHRLFFLVPLFWNLRWTKILTWENASSCKNQLDTLTAETWYLHPQTWEKNMRLEIHFEREKLSRKKSSISLASVDIGFVILWKSTATILNNLCCVCKCVHFVCLDLTHKRNMCIYCLLDCRAQCVHVEFSSKVIHYILLCVCCLSVSEMWKIWRLNYWSQLFRDGQIGCSRKCKLLCLYLLKGDLLSPFQRLDFVFGLYL